MQTQSLKWWMRPYQATWQARMECFTYRMTNISNKEPTDNAWKKTGPFKIKKHSRSNQANLIFFPTAWASLWHRNASRYCERRHFTRVGGPGERCNAPYRIHAAATGVSEHTIRQLNPGWSSRPFSLQRTLIGPTIFWLKRNSDWTMKKVMSWC